jgi:hypothetical protein
LTASARQSSAAHHRTAKRRLRRRVFEGARDLKLLQDSSAWAIAVTDHYLADSSISQLETRLPHANRFACAKLVDLLLGRRNPGRMGVKSL